MIRNFRKIKAFSSANSLVVKVYELTKDFPKEELFGITSQLRRAAVSIACNIVEGSSRQHKKDYLNFLFIARGSCAETIYLIELTKTLGMINDVQFGEISSLAEETGRVLFGLIEAVKKEI